MALHKKRNRGGRATIMKRAKKKTPLRKKKKR